MLGDITISQAAFDEEFDNPRNLYTFITMPRGVTRRTSRCSRRLEPFPPVKLDTKEGFSEAQQASLDPLLNLLYVLLALSVIVSLGIVNTLVLSVFERTRELGMLRAVGMARRQVRRMIRHESIITALIGTALGMVLGILLAVVVTQALADEGLVFSVPVVSLIVFVIVAIIAGMLAAIFPARRAAGSTCSRRCSTNSAKGAYSCAGAGRIRPCRSTGPFVRRGRIYPAPTIPSRVCAPGRTRGGGRPRPGPLALDGGHDGRAGLSEVLSIFARPSVLPPRCGDSTAWVTSPTSRPSIESGAPLAASPPPSSTTLVSRNVVASRSRTQPSRPGSRPCRGRPTSRGRTRRARRSRRTRRRR